MKQQIERNTVIAILLVSVPNVGRETTVTLCHVLCMIMGISHATHMFKSAAMAIESNQLGVKYQFHS